MTAKFNNLQQGDVNLTIAKKSPGSYGELISEERLCGVRLPYSRSLKLRGSQIVKFTIISGFSSVVLVLPASAGTVSTTSLRLEIELAKPTRF